MFLEEKQKAHYWVAKEDLYDREHWHSRISSLLAEGSLCVRVLHGVATRPFRLA